MSAHPSRVLRRRALATLSSVAVLACLTTVTTGEAFARPLSARAARTVSLKENAYLNSVRRQGSQLSEQGSEYGTFDCPLSIHMNVGTTSSTLTFTTSPKGGTISGEGLANFYVSGLVAHFSGTLRITRGTGSYSHASGSSLHISGTLQRKSLKLFATFSGTMRY